MIEEGKEHIVLYLIASAIIFVCIILAVLFNESEKHVPIKVKIVEENKTMHKGVEQGYERLCSH
jgi:hypothetical protein